MEYTKGKLCSCGFPQSHPIPHEHDRTEREKQIIEYYKGLNSDMYEALKAIAKGEGRFSRDHLTHASNTIEDMKELAVRALAKAEEV